MYYEKDWYQRQIQMGIMFIANFFFGKNWVNYEMNMMGDDPSPEAALYNEIGVWLALGEYNKAESELFSRLDPLDLGYLEIGLDLYTQLNNCTDDDLEEHGFSREEVYQGMKDLAAIFGLPVFVMEA